MKRLEQSLLLRLFQGISETAVGYRQIQSSVGGRRLWLRFVHQYLRPGEEILDIGCGTADVAAFLPQGCAYRGIDLSLPYIIHARSRYSEFEFTQGDWSSASQKSQTVLMLGVLHHLNDQSAAAALEHAFALVKPGGRLITLDGVRCTGRGRVEEIFYAIDRGKYVRSLEAYAKMFPQPPIQEVHRWLRVPYRHLVCVLSRESMDDTSFV